MHDDREGRTSTSFVDEKPKRTYGFESGTLMGEKLLVAWLCCVFPFASHQVGYVNLRLSFCFAFSRRDVFYFYLIQGWWKRGEEKMNNRSQWLLLTTRNPSARNVTLGSCGFVGKGVRYTVFLALGVTTFSAWWTTQNRWYWDTPIHSSSLNDMWKTKEHYGGLITKRIRQDT